MVFPRFACIFHGFSRETLQILKVFPCFPRSFPPCPSFGPRGFSSGRAAPAAAPTKRATGGAAAGHAAVESAAERAAWGSSESGNSWWFKWRFKWCFSGDLMMIEWVISC